jgi:hypothetical protein
LELLLIFLFSSVGLGVVTKRLGLRSYALIIATSVITIALYYFTSRFMT